VNLADCHRHRRDAKHHRQLSAKPLGRQDHTISPSASVPLVNRHICVHRIPASRVVTFAKRPSEDPRRDGGELMLIFGSLQAEYFSAQILTQPMRLIPLNKSPLPRTIALHRRI